MSMMSRRRGGNYQGKTSSVRTEENEEENIIGVTKSVQEKHLTKGE